LRLREALRERETLGERVRDAVRLRVGVLERVHVRVALPVREVVTAALAPRLPVLLMVPVLVAASDAVDSSGVRELAGVPLGAREAVGAPLGVTGDTPDGSITNTRPWPPGDMGAPPAPVPSANSCAAHSDPGGCIGGCDPTPSTPTASLRSTGM
jgi:hypothetical protein